jgi:hypothetical protein
MRSRFNPVPTVTSFQPALVVDRDAIIQLRAQLPLHRHLAIAEYLVTTGCFPRMDAEGNFVDEDGKLTDTPVPQIIRKTAVSREGDVTEYDEPQALPPKDRAKLLMDIIKKQLPDARAEDLNVDRTNAPEVREMEAHLEEMSTERLAEIAAQVPPDPVADV